MERIVLPKRIAKRLDGFSGKTVADKIDYLAERTAALNLRECNERISRFESRYGQVFSDFETALSKSAKTRSLEYSIEIDFIEWEALEQEKEHWLAVIRSLRRSSHPRRAA